MKKQITNYVCYYSLTFSIVSMDHTMYSVNIWYRNLKTNLDISAFTEQNFYKCHLICVHICVVLQSNDYSFDEILVASQTSHNIPVHKYLHYT